MSLLKWDKEFALEQAAEDEELLNELLDIFKTSFQSDILRIKDGIKSSDAQVVAAAAHSIKGAASSLGIEGITEVTRRIEDDGKSGSIEEAVHLIPQLDHMLQEIMNMTL
ncbi:Hpt domain-containing protein [Desulfosediminicola flagellatus]|uniref:Hpt domain-containing protein n=1 Tax=Desulfosediminicola flagellatus TaxID=2569541 RepID=UPI0010ACE235|nr:Hpt domain-containing protein [Desulfosediminicola flagellatus]